MCMLNDENKGSVIFFKRPAAANDLLRKYLCDDIYSRASQGGWRKDDISSNIIAYMRSA